MMSRPHRWEDLLTRLWSALESDPLLAIDVLKLLARAQEQYQQAVMGQRHQEADLAILTLIGEVTARKGPGGKRGDHLRQMMQPVISYYFPNGTEGRSPCEVEFYKRFGPQDKSDAGGDSGSEGKNEG